MKIGERAQLMFMREYIRQHLDEQNALYKEFPHFENEDDQVQYKQLKDFLRMKSDRIVKYSRWTR